VTTSPRPRLEVADILRRFADRLGPLTPWRAATVQAIVSCRTEALGGHLERCDDCGHERVSCNSCRNRHCPKCQGLQQARWVEQRSQDLLPVGYFHAVFTVPAELRPIFLSNPRIAYNALLRSSAITLLELAAQPRHLGARIGFLSVLHTWTQQLHYHPHVHCIVTGGGLDPEGTRWMSASSRFFLPQQVLEEVFRGKLLETLGDAMEAGELRGERAVILRHLRRAGKHKRFGVRLEPPFGGPDHVLRYLGRYTHRTAISNHRLVALRGDRVFFTWRDRSDGDRKKTMDLEAGEFLRRFLLHVLPKGFVRIRSYGLLANGVKRKNLALCRALLDAAPPAQPPTEETWDELLERLTGEDPLRCPACRRGRLRLVCEIPPARTPRLPLVLRPP
jgi:hypothetical protein